MKILVVEDSRTQAEYLCHILENEGYQVIVASNGNDALDQIRVDRPVLIMTDIIMPEMDGYELCRAIKQDESIAEIPVILVTQLFDPADVIKGLEAGANNFIIKPFEPDHVLTRIHSTLQSLGRSELDNTETPDISSYSGERSIVPGDLLQTSIPRPGTNNRAIGSKSDLPESHQLCIGEDKELQQTVEKLQIAYENLQRELTERKRIEENLMKENKKLRIIESFTRDLLLKQLTIMYECLDLACTLHEKDPVEAWEYITKAELLVNQTIKTLR